ncbi:putative acyl--CoA ligase YdaB [Babylonia areolata]|uniref:putative acyl--CoA ligase YdaB n=1 Tax=Babylonia areolata TaxID=304850 RepID=UPI003FD4F947
MPPPHFYTLLEALNHWAQEKPDTPAVIFRDRHQRRHVLTWASLHTLSGRFAAVLRRQGVSRGQLVLNTLPNCPERVVCEAGVWMSGAATVSGRQLRADGSDLIHTVQKSRAATLLVDPDLQALPWSELKRHVTLDKDSGVTSTSMPHLRRVLFVRRAEGGRGKRRGFLADLEARKEWFQAEDVGPEDVLSVFATSGTTGFSKLVVHTHSNMIAYLQGSVYAELFLQQAVQLNLTPLGWIGGSLPLFVLPGVTRVACDVGAGLPDDMAQFVWSTIQEEKCTSARFSPAYMADVVRLALRDRQRAGSDPDAPAVWKLTTILLTGVPVDRCMVQAGLCLAHNVCVLYGATDAGTVAANIVTDSGSFEDHDVGKPFSGIDVRIVNSRKEDEELAVNQVGDIVIKTAHFMKGYLHDAPTTTAAYTAAGFFRTGDMGLVDERGHLFVQGRGSDAIFLQDDFIVYPSRMEQRIRDFPGVQAAAVVGVPDPFLIEALCVCVVLEAGEAGLEELRKFVQDDVDPEDNPALAVARYFLCFDSFPQTDTGKPKRKEIRLQAVQRLGLSKTAN